MDKETREELIEQFRAYLESDLTPEDPGDIIDQMALFGELAGLKNEVRIESRQLKGALDDFRSVFATLDHAQQDGLKMLEQVKQQERETARAGIKTLIFGLIELYDRMSAGLDSKPLETSFFQRLLPSVQQGQKWLQGHLEGQKMLLGRVLDLLSQCGVTAMNSIGEPFDPSFMEAVGFASDLRQENGVVLQENRKGFRQGEKSLRPAEVIVNKQKEY